MKKIICTLVATLSALRVMAQGTLLVDQQSFDLTGAAGSTPVFGIGQSFTPTFSAIDYVQFGVSDVNPGSLLFVNLRQDSMSGQIIGSTDTQPVTTGDPHVPTTFLFSTRVVLTPGIQYFLEPVVVVNTTQISILLNPFGQPNPYLGGTEYHAGAPSPSDDLWFSEGVVVPEPSTWALLGLGGSVLLAVRRRQLNSRAG